MKKLILVIFICLLSPQGWTKNVYFMEIKGIISPFTEKYIQKGVDTATENNGYLVLKIDTPGGVLNSTRKIVQTIFESKIKIISYVSPQGAQAGSAGTFIVLASDLALMAEGTNIGAAHPVSATGKDIEGDMRKKVENDTTAFIKSIAEKRKRNIQMAVETVTLSKSYTAKEAMEGKLIDNIVKNDNELLDYIKKIYDEENLKATTISPNSYEKISIFLSDPNILMLLLMIAILGIFLEIKMPGTFIFAGMGITAILLFLFGINIIPLNYLSLMFILGGIALIIAEIFIPSFGVLTISAIISLIFGMRLLFNKEGNLDIQISLLIIIAIVSVILFFAFAIGRLLLRDFRKKPETGMEKFLGMTAEVKIWENSHGKVFLNGEFWDAFSDEPLSVGDVVNVTDYKNMVLYVKK